MTMLGSHNSLTYLRPRKWWQVLFHFMARCQGVNYMEQYEKYGVRLFDLRVWLDDNLNMEVRHGLMAFKSSTTFVVDFLQYLNGKGDCYVRIILEEDNFTKKDKQVTLKEEQFKNLCGIWECHFQRIRFFGGNRKYDWKVLYHFKGAEPTLDDKYSSTTSLFESDSRFLAVLDDLFPWLYARLNNKRNFRKGTDKDCLFVDFIDIR